MTALKEIAKKWGYESVADEDRLVWDKFVSSLHDKALVDRLCCSFKLSLEDVRPQVCIHEDAECKQALLFPREPVVPDHESCSIHQEDHEVSETQATERGRHWFQERRGDRSNSRRSPSTIRCPILMLICPSSHVDIEAMLHRSRHRIAQLACQPAITVSTWAAMRQFASRSVWTRSESML